jgi:hypothetical protein
MDERDIDGVRRPLSTDATLRSQDGVFAAKGTDEIVATYQGRFDVLGPTNPVTGTSSGSMSRTRTTAGGPRNHLTGHPDTQTSGPPNPHRRWLCGVRNFADPHCIADVYPYWAGAGRLDRLLCRRGHHAGAQEADDLIVR